MVDAVLSRGDDDVVNEGGCRSDGSGLLLLGVK